MVSEYPPGVPAEPFRFPARNRLIAGLSIGVVIVEGGARSGTRSTADYAVQLGLDVFAVPGPVTSPLSEAPHELIRDGARLIRGPADLLEDLGFEAMQVEAVSLDGLPAAEGGVLAALREPMLPDAVSRVAGLSIPDTVAALVRLEIRGLVQGNGGRYRRTVQLAAEAPRAARRAGCRGRGRERPTPIRVIASARGHWDDTPWPWPDPRRARRGPVSPRTDDDALPASQRDLIAAFLAHLRLERHLSPNTLAAYRTDLLHLATFLARSHRSLESVDHSTLRRFLAQQHALGYARASIARRVGAIHTFYRWAADAGRIEHDPSLLLGRPKVANRLPTVLRVGEAAALMDAAGTGGYATSRWPSPSGSATRRSSSCCTAPGSV